MRIAIIGAGFSGTALAVNLVRRMPSGVEVCLVGPDDQFGAGVAYGSVRPEHYLNVSADRMGLRAEQPGDFADWLDLLDNSREAFLPRQLYGEYLRVRLTETTAQCPSFRAIRDRAISLERVPGGYRIHLADGGDFLADRVVLAVGTLPPQPLAALDAEVMHNGAYIPWPWAEGVLDRIDTAATVQIVGTGLTMVDVVATLHNRGHRGGIEAISRHGLLPRTHGERPPRALQELPPALARVVERADLRAIVRTLRDLAHVVEDWRSLVDALRPHTQSLWRRLDLVQRGRFLRHVRAYWEVHRHRLAPDMARLLEELQRSGRLNIRAASLLHARLRAGQVHGLLRPRGSEHAEPFAADVLVRATGLDTDVGKTPHALIAHLCASGLISPDPLGLGMRTTVEGAALDVQGRAVPGLYCLGPLQRGEFWEITAVPELRVAARQLADVLLTPTAQVQAAAVPVPSAQPVDA